MLLHPRVEQEDVRRVTVIGHSVLSTIPLSQVPYHVVQVPAERRVQRRDEAGLGRHQNQIAVVDDFTGGDERVTKIIDHAVRNRHPPPLGVDDVDCPLALVTASDGL